jgi:predicted esterase YcpF (UPF0227 family)
MIINIHGFAGRGANSKYEWLKANLPGRRIIAPDIRYVATPPEEILSFFVAKIHSFLSIPDPGSPGLVVLGSSLGGFFARCLNVMFPQIVVILINPALAPFVTLRGLLNDRAYLSLFSRLTFHDDEANADERLLNVIVGDSDELIDHERLTKPLLPPNLKNYTVIKGGQHQLELNAEVAAALRLALFPPNREMRPARYMNC